jgi:hypothetical protein
MMGIQVYSKEGPSPLQRGDNYKSAKIGYDLLMKNSTIKTQIYMNAS